MASYVACTSRDLFYDVHRCLKQQEGEIKHCKNSQFCVSAPIRSEFIDKISKGIDSLQYSSDTKYLAVSYFDKFTNFISIPSTKAMCLVAATAVRLAIKVDDESVMDCRKRSPTCDQLSAMIGRRYSNQEFIRMEIMMLKVLKWKLSVPTASLFINFYRIICLSNHKKLCNGEFKIFLEMFMEIALYDPSMLREKPSKLAASIIVATNCVGDISPLFPKELKDVSQYSLREILPLVHRLIQIVYSNACCEGGESQTSVPVTSEEPPKKRPRSMAAVDISAKAVGGKKSID